MYQQALDEARKEVERFRQALGSQEHEVITLRYELRDALKTRGLAEQRFESLSSQTRYHQRMSPALQELKLVGASMQLPGATEPADMAPRPSVVAQFAHSRRSSDTRLLRDASLDAPSVVDNKKSSESIMTNAEAVTNGIGSNANPSNTFKEDYISTEVANKDSSASSETSSSSSQLSTDIHVLSSPFLPAGACGPSNPSAGATAAPTTSAKQRARVRKQTGIASHVDAQHRVSFLLNMEGSTSHSKDIGNILKKDVEEVQKTSPEATGPPLKKPNVSLEESSSVSEVPVKLPFSVGARSAQRKATGIVGQGFPKKFMPLKKKSLVLPSLTARSQPEEALDNGSYAAKNDQVQAQLKKLPGLKSPLVKFTKEDMMKKKLVAKKPPQRMIKESLSPNRMEQRQAAAVDVAVAEAAKPLPPLTRDLFPIYEDLEMRYLATDTQTRAKLFASLVKQLQSAQASMEQLLESGELLSRANERIVALTREMQQVRAHLRQTRIRCMDLQTLSARLREENRTLTIVITTVHDDLSTLLPTVSGSSESVLRRLWLLTAMRDTAATQPTNQLSKEWVYQRAASRTPPPRIAAALAVAAGRQSRSSISGVDAGRHTSLPAPAPSLTGSENQSVTFTTPLRSKQRPATSMENISPSQLALMRSERRALTAAQLQSLRSESLGETFDTLTAVTLPRRPSALGFNTTDRKDLKTRHSFMRALKPQRENGADSITPMTTANTPKPHTQQYSLNG